MKPLETSDGWDLPRPFLHHVCADAGDIDPFGHVNNAVYFKWLDAAAWAQWDADVASKAIARGEPRGMAVIHSQADYLRHVYKGDELAVAVWIAASDGRLRAERQYQIRRANGKKPGETVFRASWKLVCFDLKSGRPARMTAALANHYAVHPDVARALIDCAEA